VNPLANAILIMLGCIASVCLVLWVIEKRERRTWTHLDDVLLRAFERQEQR